MRQALKQAKEFTHRGLNLHLSIPIFFYSITSFVRLQKRNQNQPGSPPLPHSVLAPYWEAGGGALTSRSGDTAGQREEVAQGLGQLLQSGAELRPSATVPSPFLLIVVVYEHWEKNVIQLVWTSQHVRDPESVL